MIEAKTLIDAAINWVGEEHGVKCCIVIAGQIDEKGGMEVSTSCLAYPDHARTLFHMAFRTMVERAIDEPHRALYKQVVALIELFEAQSPGAMQ